MIQEQNYMGESGGNKAIGATAWQTQHAEPE